MWGSRKYPYSPTEGFGISWGGGGFYETKKFKEMYEGWGGMGRYGEVWIFSGYFLELHNVGM